MATILIVDDDAALRESLAETVSDLGHRALEAGSGERGFARLQTDSVDAVLLDLHMPGLDGMAVLEQLRTERPALPVAVLTAFANADNTIAAMRLGAFDHLTKPIGRDDLARLLRRMLQGALPTDSLAPEETNEPLIGSADAMRQVQKTIGLVADSTATVLILGETGTGKELVARALHRYGRRAGRPFVAVNCAAIPTELLESELFGHAKGAFTGAVDVRTGAFRDADRGTLFLDEIGDMPLSMQAKILRALEERMIAPVGGQPEAVDVRVIAATHHDLPARIGAGHFRDDLYFRLNVVPITVPPLRERLADIVPLAEHFLRLAAGDAPKRLSAAAASTLLAYTWPGNVRELRNAMERVAVLVRGAVIEAVDLNFLQATLDPAFAAALSDDLDLPAALAAVEQFLIRRALAVCGGNRAEAARRLNIHRQLLYEKLKKYGIEPD